MSAVPSWLAARPAWQKWVLTLVAGSGVTLALPPIYAVPVLWLVFPFIMVMLDQATRLRSVIWLGWLFGAGHMVTGLYWVGNALEIAGAPPQLAILLPLSMAFYPAVAAVLYWYASRWLVARGWMGLMSVQAGLLFALAWLVGEWLRGNLFTGFPWNLVAYSWAFSDVMSQAVALFGAYGLSLLTVFVATLSLPLVARPLKSLSAWGGIAVAATLVGAQAGYGFDRLASAGQTQFHDIRVRLVQSNIQQKDKWRPDLRTENFVKHLMLSERPGAGDVDLLVWPETAVPYYLDEDPSRTVMMGRIIRPDGVIVTGVPRREIRPDGSRRFYNSLLVIGADGAVRDTFDKFHLVPFGEFVPFHGLLKQLGIEKIVEGAGDFSPGDGARLIELDGLASMSPLICYEVIFPGKVVPDGPRPDFIMNVTNDAWYGRSSGPYQHLMITRFRAIEEGLPVLRAAGTGISAIIDAYGRTVNELALHKAGIVDGLLPQDAVATPLFGIWGNAIVPALALLLVLLVLLVGKLEALISRQDV
jgi:apolipoprotein N-acyltransferase